MPEDPDRYCGVTFEDWFYKEYPKGLDLQGHPMNEYCINQEVKDLMKQAWDNRYFTLTYHDI